MIIDEKMIRDQIVAHEKCDETCPGLELRGKDVVETLEKLWRVARAAEKIVRPGPRQSKENAPLEYALWEALSALNEPQSGDAPNDTNAEEEARNAALDEAAKVANGHRHASGNTCLCAFFIRDEIRALKK